LVEGIGELLDCIGDAGTSAPVADVDAVLRPNPPPPFAVWTEERSATLARSSRPTAVAATALSDEVRPDAGIEPDAGLQKRQPDLDLPPWLKGRYGTSVGRAVHAVLQTIDLASGSGLDAAVLAQCEAEAIPDRSDDVRRLASYALASPSVLEASVRPHWREVYACTPLTGGRLLEGYVDLLYRSEGGLVVVDYKTASAGEAGLLDDRVHGYRLQGASYALAVTASAGESVLRVTFVFLTADGPVERHLPDLESAVADVRALVAAGREVMVE
jgi:ATP-dependent helicase/nuclease subunit A